MRRGLRWLVRIVGGLVALVALALGAVLIALHTDWGRNRVREQIVKQLQAALPGSKLARIDGSVLGTLSLRGLEIAGRDGKPWITVGSIDVRVSLWPLVTRTVRIDSLAISDVVVDQHPQPPKPPEPESNGPSAWTIELVHGAIRGARVRVVSGFRTLAFDDLEADLSATYAGGAATAVVAARGTWSKQPIAARAVAYYRDGTLAAPYAEAELGGAVASIFGFQLDDVIGGDVVATVPAATAAAIAHVNLPADVTLAANVGKNGALDARAAIGDASVRVIGTAAALPLRADAIAIADVPDGTILDPRFAGTALVTAALSGGAGGVRGMIAISAARPLDQRLLGSDGVTGTAMIALDVAADRAWVLLDSAADLGGTRARLVADLARAKDGSIAVTSSSLVASASRIGKWTSEAHVGTLGVRLAAKGPLWPKPDLYANGTLSGSELRYGPLRLATTTAQFDTHHITQANLHLELGNASLGPRPLGSASFDLRAARDAGGVIDIAIDKHQIATAANGTWAGTGGRVRIEPSQIAVDDLHTSSGNGEIVASGVMSRTSSNLRVALTATNVALATVQPDFGGTVGATVNVERRGGSWQAKANVQGRAVVIAGQAPTDLDVALDVAGRHVKLQTSATAPEGKIAVAGDLDGPYDLTDGRAWRRLARSSLHELTISADHVQLAKVGASGTVSGSLSITGTGASGDLSLRGFETPKGTVDADLSVAPDPNGVLANVSARLEGDAATAPPAGAARPARVPAVAAVTGQAEIALPERPFDPAQWRALGPRALRRATAQIAPLDFDPSLLARAHLQLPYKGHLEAKIEVAEGATSITATADVAKLTGGAIAAPVAAHVEAALTAQGLHVTGTATSDKTQLVTVDATTPIAIDTLRAWRTKSLTGTVAMPNVPAAQIISTLGRHDVTSGTVDGTVTFGGTLGAPTAQLQLAATDIVIPAGVAGRAPSRLETLGITGGWDGTNAKLSVNGKEASGGTVAITAGGRPDRPTTLTATVDAVKLDLAPFAAFAVGALSAARGTVDAKLALHGFDPATGDVSGQLDVHDGRIPLSPLFGTLRAAAIHVAISNHAIDATVAAKLGKGELKGTAKVALVGSTPAKATASLVLHEISLVRAMQPTIDATVDAKFAHEGTAWRGTIDVSKSRVVVAQSGGVELLASDAPGDMEFTDRPPPTLVPLLQRPAPQKPWLFATIDLGHTGVEVVQDEYQVHGSVSGKLKLSLGEGVGMDGSLEAVAQNLEILGARAQLDHATVTWDGTLDPMLDVVALRELTNVTVTATVTGRLSKPRVEMSSDGGEYTQGELIGYFLGGTASSGGSSSTAPSGTSDIGQSAAAAGVGAASALLTSQLRKVLPRSMAKYASRLSFSYEVASASSSEGFRFGYWVSKHVFVALHQHLDPLPDENGTEGIGEWHFRNTMMLQGNAGDRGIAGLDLVRRWRW